MVTGWSGKDSIASCVKISIYIPFKSSGKKKCRLKVLSSPLFVYGTGNDLHDWSIQGGKESIVKVD